MRSDEWPHAKSAAIMPSHPPDATPIGYVALVERLGLNVVPHYRASYVARRGTLREIQADGVHQFIYPISYLPDDSTGSHLEFSLKHDGTNLEILKAVFTAVDQEEIESYILEKPNGKYTRRLWFFYELLLERRLPIPDLKIGNYIDALNKDEYYTSIPIRAPRQRVNDNLLGTRAFCPIVRRTAQLKEAEALELDRRAAEVLSSYDKDTINRAVAYLYTKETLSSFMIERERPTRDRADRFAALLKRAPAFQELDHGVIIEVRNLIVEDRYKRNDYRTDEEVYVGESLSNYHQKVHFVGAPANLVIKLMDGLLSSYERMRASGVHPVIIAAAISFGFVFIHPFDDGNGRTHRFLIHYILAKNKFTPEGVIFPVSSTMVSNLREYDNCLESFSKPLMNLVKYELDDEGKISILDSPTDAYRHFDATHIAQYLFHCIQQTITIEFKQELDFIVALRTAKARMREIVDMPDRKMDLFIKFCLQNGGKLSKGKMEREFPEITAEEVASLEQAIKDSIGSAAVAFHQQA